MRIFLKVNIKCLKTVHDDRLIETAICLFSIFSEADFDPDSYNIPFVVASVSKLASEVHSLLQSHDGSLPLLR